MTQQEPDASSAGWRGTPALRRVANLAAHLVGGVGLAFGAADTLAKRRKKNADGLSESERDAQREERRHASRTDRDDDGQAEKRQARQERREAREEDHDRDHHSRSRSVDQDQRANNNNNNNNNGNNNSNNSNSDNNNSNDNSDDGGGNGSGNAGSGFFDSPLASKARRRAKDFDNGRNQDDNPKDDHLTAHTDDDGHHFETNSISFTNGPDGLEVITRNIDYSAPPTPTPTPFPTLTLPERDRLDVFGDRVIAAPTAVPSDNGASNGAAPPPSGDTGSNVSTGSRPTPTPPAGDTSGGDNTSDFLS